MGGYLLTVYLYWYFLADPSLHATSYHLGVFGFVTIKWIVALAPRPSGLAWIRRARFLFTTRKEIVQLLVIISQFEQACGVHSIDRVCDRVLVPVHPGRI